MQTPLKIALGAANKLFSTSLGMLQYTQTWAIIF